MPKTITCQADLSSQLHIHPLCLTGSAPSLWTVGASALHAGPFRVVSHVIHPVCVQSTGGSAVVQLLSIRFDHSGRQFRARPATEPVVLQWTPALSFTQSAITCLQTFSFGPLVSQFCLTAHLFIYLLLLFYSQSNLLQWSGLPRSDSLQFPFKIIRSCFRLHQPRLILLENNRGETEKKN